MRPQHRTMKFGWLVEAGVLLVVASPVLWGLSSAFGWPRGVRHLFMWLTVVLVALALLGMAAAPFLTRSERRAWKSFTPPSGITYAPDDPGLLGPLMSFPAPPFEYGRAAETHVIDALSTTVAGIPLHTFTLERKDAGEPRERHRVLVAQVPQPLPYLALRATMDLTPHAMWGSRVEIEYGEFNRRYLVCTYDSSAAARKYAVDVLHPRAVQELLGVAPFDLTIYGRFAVHSTILGVHPKDALRLLQTEGQAMAHLVSLIPAHVYAENSKITTRPTRWLR